MRRTSLTLQTSMAPPSDTDPPSKVAATVTRQPFIFGKVRVALALGASGPEWVTSSVSAMTVMAATGISLPFTTMSAVAGSGLAGLVAARGPVAGVTGAVTAESADGGACVVSG